MSRRFGSKLSAFMFVVAAGACLSGSALADQTHVDYNLAAGAKSALIAVPIKDSPHMGCFQSSSCSQSNSFVCAGRWRVTREAGRSAAEQGAERP